MTSYALFIYLVTSPGWSSSTGGPAIIDGFSSLEKCEIAHQAVKEQVPKYEWGKCIKVVK